MEVYRTHSFEREFLELPKNVQDRFEVKLAFFLRDPFHPSLQSKKMGGAHGIWEVRISKGYRFTFSIQGHTYLLRRIGTHDILRRP